MKAKMGRIPESKRGIAVIMAMWLLAVLAVIGSTFAYMMRLEPIIARHHRDEVKAMNVAQAGLDKAYARLKAGQTVLSFEGNFTDVGTYEVNVAGVYFFTFKGGITPTFYRYNAHEDEWETMKYAPAAIDSGGALAWGGGGYVYGLRGKKTTDFYRYKLSTNNWKKMTDINDKVDWGGALVHWYKYNETSKEYDHYLYATRGNSTTDFYFYDIANKTWAAKANTLDSVGAGGALAWTGGYSIYATRGGGYSHFYLYDIDTNWYSRAYAPDTIAAGGSLAWTGGDYIYATRGGSYSFWRYKISNDEWNPAPGDSPEITSGVPAVAPDTIDAGGSLVWSGRDYIYALRGGSRQILWRYKISTNEWNPHPGDSPAITDGDPLGTPKITPGPIGDGGSLTRSGDLYWINSTGYVPNKANARAKKKIEAIVDTSAKGLAANRIIYWKEIPED